MSGGRAELRVVQGSAEATAGEPLDPEVFQADCVHAYVASWVARGYSQVTIDASTSRSWSGCWRRWASRRGRWRPRTSTRWWEPGRRWGIAASTRRTYVQAFKGFHEFLTARKAVEIESAFGVRLQCPLDEFNAARHVGNDSAPSTKAPPTTERMEDFFAFLRDRVATARKFGPAARDYALFRTLYHAGLRADEAASLEMCDLHFGRGPFGKLHVRFGKGAKTSGPRPRWVPLLDGWT